MYDTHHMYLYSRITPFACIPSSPPLRGPPISPTKSLLFSFMWCFCLLCTYSIFAEMVKYASFGFSELNAIWLGRCFRVQLSLALDIALFIALIFSFVVFSTKIQQLECISYSPRVYWKYSGNLFLLAKPN